MGKSSNLDDWFQAFEINRQNREERIVQLSEKLGTPDYVEEGEFENRGYWRVRGGIICYRIRKDNSKILTESRIEYLDDWFNKMDTVRNMPPRN